MRISRGGQRWYLRSFYTPEEAALHFHRARAESGEDVEAEEEQALTAEEAVEKARQEGPMTLQAADNQAGFREASG